MDKQTNKQMHLIMLIMFKCRENKGPFNTRKHIPSAIHLAKNQPVVVQFLGPRGEPTTIILQNGHSTKLLSKFVALSLYSLTQLSDIFRESSLCSEWSMQKLMIGPNAQTKYHGGLSHKRDICMTHPLPRLTDLCEREDGKIAGARGHGGWEQRSVFWI